MTRERDFRRDICEVGRRLYQAGMMPGSDGNLSVVLNEKEILISPSRLCKGYMEPDDIIKIDRKGNKISGELPPSVETLMHLAAYEERPDISAVVHAHPPIVVAFTVAGVTLPSCVLPEIEVLFGGEVPVAPYATPGSAELADAIRKPIQEKNVVLLPHHGALSVGVNIFQAGLHMEHVEAAARIIFYARQLGGEHRLSAESVASLRALRERVLETEQKVFCAHCHACDKSGEKGEQQSRNDRSASQVGEDELTSAIVRAVESVFRSSL